MNMIEKFYEYVALATEYLSLKEPLPIHIDALVREQMTILWYEMSGIWTLLSRKEQKEIDQLRYRIGNMNKEI